MKERVNNTGLRCAICNRTHELFEDRYNKICLNCYFTNDKKVPKHIPFEQHDLWIIKNHRKEQK